MITSSMQQFIDNAVVVGVLNSVLGTVIIFVQRYWIKKVEKAAEINAAETLTQIEEGVKFAISKQLEDYKQKLQREEELLKPQIELAQKIDRELLDKIVKLNALIKETQASGKSRNDSLVIIQEKQSSFDNLAQHISNYSFRYQNVPDILAVQDIHTMLQENGSTSIESFYGQMDLLSNKLESIQRTMLGKLEVEPHS